MIDRFLVVEQIAAELWRCDDEELEALHRMVVAIRKRRELLEAGRQLGTAEIIDRRRERIYRVQAHRPEQVIEGLRELRDAATTYSRREEPQITFDGGGES